MQAVSGGGIVRGIVRGTVGCRSRGVDCLGPGGLWPSATCT